MFQAILVEVEGNSELDELWNDMYYQKAISNEAGEAGDATIPDRVAFDTAYANPALGDSVLRLVAAWNTRQRIAEVRECYVGEEDDETLEDATRLEVERLRREYAFVMNQHEC